MSEVQRVTTLEQMREILATAKTIAVVGLSDRSERPSHGVAAYLQAQGYRIIPVNPNVTEVLGEKAYANLREVPDAVDIVDVFRRSEYVPPIVEDAIAIEAKVVWMQLGVIHHDAAARAMDAGLKVVMNECTAATHRQLRAMGKI